MKRLVALTCFLIASMILSAQSGPDYDAIADKIVKHSLEVKPGEVVIITGTTAEEELMAALLVAVSKAGGKPYIELTIPYANKRAAMETPIKYLKIPSAYPLIQARAADCFINTVSTQDPALFKDVPEDRLAAIRQSGAPYQSALSRIRNRNVSLGQTGGIPSQAYASLKGADYEDMVIMFWKSLDTDYQKILERGTFISALIKPGSELSVTGKTGTKLTFKVADQPARINCGQCAENIAASGAASVWLPAGEVYVCVDPTSANGTIVIPGMTYRGYIIKNLIINLKNGHITDLKADANAAVLQESLEKSTGAKDVLSVVDIGLNPDSHPLQGSDYYSWEMGGMITLYIGNNTWAGGNIESDIGIALHLANSSITVDGKSIVTNGILELPEHLTKK